MKKIISLAVIIIASNACFSQKAESHQFYLKVKLDNGKLYSSFYQNLSELKNDGVLEHLNIRYYTGESSLKLDDDGILNLNGVEAHIANKKYTGKPEAIRKGIEFQIDTTSTDSTIITIVMRNGQATIPLNSVKTSRILDEAALRLAENYLNSGGTGVGRLGLNVKFPTLHFTDIKNGVWENKSFENKIVVLNFWFIGCKPCIKEIPELNKLVETFKSKDVIFLAFANDNQFDIEDFLIKRPFNYHIIPNASSFAIKQLGIHNFPTHAIIDPEGKVRFVKTGYSAKTIEDMYETIRDLLPLTKS